MTSIKEEVESTPNQEGEILPGEQLRKAREKSGLTREEVASHLKLSVQKINMLERGELDELAAPVFVAGYLRAYAKLVDISGDEIVDAFKTDAASHSPSKATEAGSTASQFGQSDSTLAIARTNTKEKNRNQVVIYSSIILVAIIVIVAFYMKDGEETAGEAEVVLESTNLKEEVVTGVSAGTMRADSNETNPVDDHTGTAKDDAEERQDRDELGVADSSSSEQVSQDVPVEDLNQAIAKQENTNQVARQKEPEKAAVTNSDSSQLSHSVVVFNFKEDSWVEVTDALGKKLLYRTAKAGASNTVWGVAPFKVRLGYVNGVDIMLNGKPYDLSRFSNRRSVRFTLGN